MIKICLLVSLMQPPYLFSQLQFGVFFVSALLMNSVYDSGIPVVGFESHTENTIVNIESFSGC
jgi:hypothetical protein